jgi:hypothetical protein
MEQTATDIKRRLNTIVSEQQQLLTAFGEALTSGDAAKQGAAQKQLLRLSAEMQRLTDDLRYAKSESNAAATRPRARATGKTMREGVLDILDEIGVPLAPSTISEFSQATTGVEVPASRFASLRRDEERSARRDLNSRPAWVAPALNTTRLNAFPRLLTSSAWALERRLIGARSFRVNHLRTTLAFVERFERMQTANVSQVAAIESLLLRYARGIPGALTTGKATDPQKIRKIIAAELQALEADDLAERQHAATRLSRSADQHKIWGLPLLIEGGAQGGRAEA